MFNAQLASLRQQNQLAVKKAVAEADAENDAMLEKLEDALAEAELSKREARALSHIETEKNARAKSTLHASGLKQLRFCMARMQKSALFRVFSSLKMGRYVARIPTEALLPHAITKISNTNQEANEEENEEDHEENGVDRKEQSVSGTDLRIREVVFEKDGPLGLKVARRAQDLHCYVDRPKGQALELGVQHQDTILAINGSKVFGLAPDTIVGILKRSMRPLRVTLEAKVTEGEAIGVGFEIWRGSTSAPDSTAKIMELRAREEKGARAIEMIERIERQVLPTVESLLNQKCSTLNSRVNPETDPYVVALAELHAIFGHQKIKEPTEDQVKLKEAQAKISFLQSQLKEQAAVIAALQGAVDKGARPGSETPTWATTRSYRETLFG